MYFDEEPFLSAIDFHVSAPIVPWEADEFYVQEITGKLSAMVNDREGVKAGTIELLKIQAVEVENNHLDLLDVCDAHSDYLVAMYHAIFDEEGETKRELEIEPSWNDILVLWKFDIPEEFRKVGAIVRAFETAIKVWGSTDLVIASFDKEESDFIGLALTVDEWRQLGFQRIAGTPFAFRDNCCINPYGIKIE
ncbi:MAG: hypothetical protein IT426_21130 [Pirellulales bacterium]|nr:hypothetical protein [Pirellulales bacterium]